MTGQGGGGEQNKTRGEEGKPALFANESPVWEGEEGGDECAILSAS